MESIIKKIVKLGLHVESVYFDLSKNVDNYLLATLSIENSSIPILKGLPLRKINVTTLFDLGTEEDKCIDTLLAMAGLDYVSTTETQGSVGVEEVQVGTVPQKTTEPVKTNGGPCLGGFSVPSMPTMSAPNGAGNGSGNGYVRPAPPAPPKLDVEVPPKVAKKTGGIRDVQMMAIQAMLKIKKTNYEELVKAAFEENNIEVEALPTIENLTENQALEVIKYGNTKYKNQ